MASSKAFTAAPESLQVYETPKNDVVHTQSMEYVYEAISERSNKIIHIHGMPGSGKSQIVAVTCQKMANEGYIVWRVQCQPGLVKIKNGWENLARKMLYRNLISQDDRDDIFHALHDPNTVNMGRLAKALTRSNQSILLAVELEDNTSIESMADDIHILKPFINALSSDSPKIQILIASRNVDIIFLNGNVAPDFYETYEVTGFTEEEAKSFLTAPSITYSEEKMCSLAKELAYSPFGLLMAKNYCLEYSVSYDDYYDSLGKDDLIVAKEKELLNRYPDLGKNHRYEIIMKLLKPDEHKSDEVKEYQIMQMMAFLNKNSIPRQILESFFRQKEHMKSSDAKIKTAHLIRKLEKRVGCKRCGENDNELLSLHGDVLRVLQSTMNAKEKTDTLCDVVFSLTSMLDKDNRLRKDYGTLYELKNHVAEVAFHCSDHFQNSENLETLEEKRYEMILCLSRIHELIGFAISQHPGARSENEEDGYFEKAMDYMWTVVTMHADKSVVKTVFDILRGKRKKDPTSLISHQRKKDPQKTAGKVFQACHDALRNKTLYQTLEKEYRRNFPLKSTDLSIMQKADNNSSIDWKKLSNELEVEGSLSDQSYQQLIKAKFILAWKDLSTFYIAERMASILHSRGRQDNYKRDLLDGDMIEKCNWWVDFGYHLCATVDEKTGFKSLFHFILRANNKLHKLSINRDNESDSDFKQRIYEVREMATAIQNENVTFYEHGKLRVVSGTPWTVLNASKYLIKANTKIHKRPALLHDFPVEQADTEAEALYSLAVSNRNIVVVGTCLVHVGKYFAAREKFQRAFEAFEQAFQLGIESEVKNNATRFAWTLYNTHRALVAAGEHFRDERTMSDIQRRYDMTKDNGTPDKWVIKLASIRADMPSSDQTDQEESERVRRDFSSTVPSGDTHH